MAAIEDIDAAKTLLRSVGLPTTENFRTDLGDDVAEADLLNTSRAGRRLYASVLDTPTPRALPVVENIDDNSGMPLQMYFADQHQVYSCPAVLPGEISAEAQRIALVVHELLGFRDTSRTTLSLTSKGLAISAMSANPLLCVNSLFVTAARVSGYSFEDLIWHLVSQAVARHVGSLDIASSAVGIASDLSNFHDHAFVVDNGPCRSIEGLLQALKFSNEDVQRNVCNLAGREAKLRGTDQNIIWQGNQTLFWRGQQIPRQSEEYQQFLDRAFLALFSQSDKFRDALQQTGQRVRRHSIGERNPARTCLTEREFVRRLSALRATLPCTT